MELLRKIKNKLPKQEDIQQFRYIHLFGQSFKKKELWHFTRDSTSKGIAIGIFCAFLPMPFEMIAAIFMAITLRGHLPLAIAGVWISNPITWIPLYTPCYLLGSKIINIQPVPLSEVSILQLGSHYVALWLGCLIIGSVVALSSHFIIQLMWIAQVKQRWLNRRQRKNKK